MMKHASDVEQAKEGSFMRAMYPSLMLMAIGVALIRTASAGQPLETESARMLKHRGLKLEGGFEHQISSAGTETAVPLALEYGATDRLEVLVEPVLYSAIRDKGTPAVTGIGDLEMTVTGLVSGERPRLPAIALAAEAKVPTADNIRIGSGKADYSLYLIGSKRVGAWDTHANLGYTLIGRPAGAEVNNVASFAVAEEFHPNPRLDLVAEVLGSTAALRESGSEPIVANESQLTPEIGAGELFGTLGLRLHAGSGLTYSLGISVDNNNATLVHPGVAVSWQP